MASGRAFILSVGLLPVGGDTAADTMIAAGGCTSVPLDGVSTSNGWFGRILSPAERTTAEPYKQIN